MSESVGLNLAYSYGPPSVLKGPLFAGGGPIAGTSVRGEFDVHVLSMGVSVNY